MTITTPGSCLCGKTTFTVTHEDDYKPPTMICHCKDCQILSGGFGTFNIAFPIDGIAWSGSNKSYACTGDSGVTNDKVFCGDCGATMATMAGKRKLAIVKVPCLKDAGEKYDVTPQAEQYVQSKYAFEPATYHADAKQYPGMK